MMPEATLDSVPLNSSLVDPLQQTLLRSAGLCGHATRSGRPCRAPWIAEANQCGMGHGLSPEQIRELRRRAGEASHAIEARVEGWARRIDWSTTEGVHDCLEMCAEMVMRRLLSPQQAGAIAQLAGVRLRPVAKPEEEARPLEVIVQKFAATEAPAR
jgi:hypothetical protein